VSIGSDDPARVDDGRTLGQRLVAAGLVVLLVLAPPAALAALLGGTGALRGAVLGAVFGLLLCLRSGWRRTLLVTPLLVLGLGLGLLVAGTAWWVLLVVAVATAAGLATRVGALAPVALVGMVVCTTLDGDGRQSLALTAAWAAAALVYTAVVLRRLGVPDVVAGRALAPREAWPVAAVLGAVVGVAAWVAQQWSSEYAYWLPMTVLLIAVPVPGLRLSHAVRSRLLGTAGGVAAGALLALVAVPAPVRAALVVALLLLVLAVPTPLWLNAGLATVLVVVALDPSAAGLAAGGTRLLATAEAAALVLLGVSLLVWLGRWPSARPAEQHVVDEAVAAQNAM
jgi:hypothetical protein